MIFVIIVGLFQLINLFVRILFHNQKKEIKINAIYTLCNVIVFWLLFIISGLNKYI